MRVTAIDQNGNENIESLFREGARKLRFRLDSSGNATELFGRLIGVRQTDHCSRGFAFLSQPQTFSVDTFEHRPANRQNRIGLRLPYLAVAAGGREQFKVRKSRSRLQGADDLPQAVAIRFDGPFVKSGRGEIAPPKI